jgi:uncharacterized protein (DUF1015 family)
MADVQPLTGVRYNPRRQANLGRLIAPPYDTLAPGPADGDGFRPSFNIAELENVDLGAGADSHALAAARYDEWRASGLLVRDDAPALYVHDHTYADGDRVRRRRGLLARVRLAEWSEGVILPHERTFPGPRNERLARLRAVRANLSPLYLLYHDRAGHIRELLTTTLATAPPVASGTDATGGGHTLTRLTDPIALAQVTGHLAGERLFVADGHHRYEAALAYRDEQRAAGGQAGAPSEYVLAMLADIADPGVQVRPTHRAVYGLANFDTCWLHQHLSTYFAVETGSSGEAGRPDLICSIALPGESHPWRVYPLPGRPHERLLPDERSQAWRSLDVAIGDGVILNTILGLDPSRVLDHVTFTHNATTARSLVDAGEAQLAIIYAPPSLPALARVAAAGDTLPPKSTYFDPKPPAGLVINDLREP